jgi:hypothetical protein
MHQATGRHVEPGNRPNPLKKGIDLYLGSSKQMLLNEYLYVPYTYQRPHAGYRNISLLNQ